VGAATRDDAGVYRLNARTALVYTTDFFTPVVDDPFDFGRIAAANALSDVYAMGATPLMALNLVAFPARELPLEILGRILEGGHAVATEAGVPIVGGHSIDDPEPKYGLAVVGTVAPGRVLTNAGARPGDVLILTKPLGSGIVTTAIKRERATAAEIREVTALMAGLNLRASEVLMRHRRSVHACTDVTGFGLLGHLLEMLEASGVGARLASADVPILEAARRHAAAGLVPGGTDANLESVAGRVHFGGALAEDRTAQRLLADAQTSGGLLAAVSRRSTRRVVAALEAAGVAATPIGEIVAGEPSVVVDP
jgi:selenide, water dikinase